MQVTRHYPLVGCLKPTEEETKWNWQGILYIVTKTIPRWEFPTRKPEEEAVKLKEWAEVEAHTVQVFCDLMEADD